MRCVGHLERDRTSGQAQGSVQLPLSICALQKSANYKAFKMPRPSGEGPKSRALRKVFQGGKFSRRTVSSSPSGGCRLRKVGGESLCSALAGDKLCREPGEGRLVLLEGSLAMALIMNLLLIMKLLLIRQGQGTLDTFGGWGAQCKTLILHYYRSF